MHMPTIFVALFVATLPPQEAQPLESGCASIVRRWHESGEFDGVALVASKGKPVMKIAVGPADRSWDTPLTVDACFPICSLTKQFTAVLVLDAMERGELALDEGLGEVFQELDGRPAASVTIRQLLLHSGGFQDPPMKHYVDPARTLKSDLEIAREYLFDQEPGFEPGTQFRYSNADYHWLGAVLEARTKKRFSKLLEERITAPLGMKRTGLANRAAVQARRPRDYVRQEGVGWIHTPAYQWSNWQAAGGLESTVADLHRWNQALAGGELLEEKTTALMLTVPPQPGSYVALGCWSYPRALPGTDVTLNIAERRGAIGGFAVLNAFDLERGDWVILLSNHANRTLDTLSYAPCLPLDLLCALHGGTIVGPPGR